MSRAGYLYDNAPMERYFNTLKTELLNVHEYSKEKELYKKQITTIDSIDAFLSNPNTTSLYNIREVK